MRPYARHVLCLLALGASGCVFRPIFHPPNTGDSDGGTDYDAGFVGSDAAASDTGMHDRCADFAPSCTDAGQSADASADVPGVPNTDASGGDGGFIPPDDAADVTSDAAADAAVDDVGDAESDADAFVTDASDTDASDEAVSDAGDEAADDAGDDAVTDAATDAVDDAAETDPDAGGA